MTYLQDRLRHASSRFAELNFQPAVYEAVRDGVSYSYPLDVSPILMASDEVSPGSPSITRVEYQDFAIQVTSLGHLYPPQNGDEIRIKANGQVFQTTPIGMDEPCFQHITSMRERVMIHTLRMNRGY